MIKVGMKYRINSSDYKRNNGKVGMVLRKEHDAHPDFGQGYNVKVTNGEVVEELTYFEKELFSVVINEPDETDYTKD